MGQVQHHSALLRIWGNLGSFKVAKQTFFGMDLCIKPPLWECPGESHFPRESLQKNLHKQMLTLNKSEMNTNTVIQQRFQS